MQMLYRYADEGKCKFLGVVVNREGERCTGRCDEYLFRLSRPAHQAGLLEL